VQLKEDLGEAREDMCWYDDAWRECDKSNDENIGTDLDLRCLKLPFRREDIYITDGDHLLEKSDCNLLRTFSSKVLMSGSFPNVVSKIVVAQSRTDDTVDKATTKGTNSFKRNSLKQMPVEREIKASMA
jgi:hypothetical protein